MAAIRLLQELEFEGLQASPEQQEILSRYVGWGGLADAFDENKPNWSDEFAELYATLSPEEYAAADIVHRTVYASHMFFLHVSPDSRILIRILCDCAIIISKPLCFCKAERLEIPENRIFPQILTIPLFQMNFSLFRYPNGQRDRLFFIEW